jgi:hypothetical protein
MKLMFTTVAAVTPTTASVNEEVTAEQKNDEDAAFEEQEAYEVAAALRVREDVTSDPQENEEELKENEAADAPEEDEAAVTAAAAPSGVVVSAAAAPAVAAAAVAATAPSAISEVAIAPRATRASQEPAPATAVGATERWIDGDSAEARTAKAEEHAACKKLQLEWVIEMPGSTLQANDASASSKTTKTQVGRKRKDKAAPRPDGKQTDSRPIPTPPASGALAHPPTRARGPRRMDMPPPSTIPQENPTPQITRGSRSRASSLALPPPSPAGAATPAIAPEYAAVLPSFVPRPLSKTLCDDFERLFIYLPAYFIKKAVSPHCLDEHHHLFPDGADEARFIALADFSISALMEMSYFLDNSDDAAPDDITAVESQIVLTQGVYPLTASQLAGLAPEYAPNLAPAPVSGQLQGRTLHAAHSDTSSARTPAPVSQAAHREYAPPPYPPPGYAGPVVPTTAHADVAPPPVNPTQALTFHASYGGQYTSATNTPLALEDAAPETDGHTPTYQQADPSWASRLTSRVLAPFRSLRPPTSAATVYPTTYPQAGPSHTPAHAGPAPCFPPYGGYAPSNEVVPAGLGKRGRAPDETLEPARAYQRRRFDGDFQGARF